MILTPSTCAHSQPSAGRLACPTKPFSWRAGCESSILSSSNLSMLEADYLGHAGQLDAAVDLYQKAIQSYLEDPNSTSDCPRCCTSRSASTRPSRPAPGSRLAGDEELKEVLATARGEDGYREIERARVRLELDLMKARAVVNYVSPLEFGRTYAQLGEKEQAFQTLDAAFVDRSPGLVFLRSTAPGTTSATILALRRPSGVWGCPERAAVQYS